MATRVKVVLYGDTLVLAGLQASLAAYAGLEVLCLADSLADAQDFTALRADVVIVDAAAMPSPPLRLLNNLPPDLLLVSVDVAANRVQVWSSQQLSPASTHELVALIGQRKEAGAESPNLSISQSQRLGD
jgi:DNA-binding NarL/FixJ family response regulator